MLCSRIRTALSARLDGEALPPGLTARRLDDHLAGCQDCRRWDARARALDAALGSACAPEGDVPPPAGGPGSAEALLARLRPGRRAG
ncbi:zf-HC2 domain-containing protein [Streptomyces sp. RS10V-4]|uniref:zf-HC2 domain-containing protein n=1 Tax=Streptomyces rhizoryzae TaxID=2932493 RepID=UPI002005FBF1|nr:zf-HC2 domain-containing protein [Streptomyces rhizoryzae]MCK7627800.1 zf-HC2 domain-containing protein [Streptomyces rhizoryzae]